MVSSVSYCSGTVERASVHAGSRKYSWIPVCNVTSEAGREGDGGKGKRQPTPLWRVLRGVLQAMRTGQR